MRSGSQVVRVGSRWPRRLLLLFLAAGVVFINLNNEHRVVLIVSGSALAIANTLWLRHLLRQQGIDPDADERAEVRESVRDILRNK